MISRVRILLALATCTAPGLSQETSKDEMWKMLNRSSLGGARDDRPPTPGSPSSRFGPIKPGEPGAAILQEQYRRLALAAAKVGQEQWPEANLKYGFGEGWRKADGGAFNEIVRTYYHPEKELSVVVSFIGLTQGDNTDPEELLKPTVSKRVTLKAVESTGRAADLGMRVFEGSATDGDQSGYRMTMGKMAVKGGVYGFCAVAKDLQAARQEFDRFLGSLDWIEKDKDFAKPAVTELAVSGAGFSVSCEGALMATASPAQPYASAAFRLDQRIEITAFDVSGSELPLRDLVAAYLNLVAVSTGGNHVLEEQTVGGVPGLRALPKTPATMLGREMDWRMDFALRDGFFCVAMGTWPKEQGEFAKRHDELAAKIRFSKPEGQPRPLGSAEERQFASMFYNEVGLKGFQRGQYSTATRAFERAVEITPNDVNMAQNLVNSLTKQGKIKSALAAVEKARNSLPESRELKQWNAALLIRSDREAEATVLYEELFKGGMRDEGELGLWIEALQKSGKNERAVAIARTVFEETSQISWRHLLANCLWTAGKLDEAQAHFKDLATDLGNEQGFAADHASLLLELRDFKAVMDLVGKWEKENEAPPAMLFSKGMAQCGLGWHKDAVDTFTRLDGMVPGNQTVKEALANAQAMMGRGSLEGIREDLAEVTIPELLKDHAAQALAAADVEKDYTGEGSVTLANLRVWEWHEGSDARMTQLQRIRILDASGVKAFSTLYVPFKPNAERLNIHRMTVTDKNGKQLATYRREEMHVRDSDGGLADGSKVACIPVPTLEEGAVIEFVYTVSQLGTDKKFPMTTGGISEYAGLVYGAVAFTGEIGKIRFAATDRLKEIANDSLRAFEASNLKRRIGTAHIPPYDQWGLMLWACDNRTLWESETADYLAEIHECLADDAFAAKVVSDLDLAGKSPAEVTRRVVRWLNEKFQYQGLEFGRRARIPAKGEITLSRGFGDCKDLSLMVRAVLRQAGVKADLALVSSSGIVREDIPGLDQFDHMVVHLPEMGGTILDPTMQHFNTPEALSVTALGGRAFVIEGDHPGFTTMNEAAGTERLMTVDRAVKIDVKSGDAHVTETVTLSPAEAALMRYALSATAGAERLKTVENMMRRKESRVELKDFKIHDLDDPFKDFKMDLEYILPHTFQPDGEILSGTLPGVMESWMFGMEPERDRSIGTRIHAAERCVIHIHLQNPDGYKWIAPAELKRESMEAGSFEGTAEWQPTADGIDVQATLKLIPSNGDAELYQRVRTANDALFRNLGERLRFARN